MGGCFARPVFIRGVNMDQIRKDLILDLREKQRIIEVLNELREMCEKRDKCAGCICCEEQFNSCALNYGVPDHWQTGVVETNINDKLQKIGGFSHELF